MEASGGTGSNEAGGRLAGKKALVTGGDSGIGRAVAEAFAGEGADVAFVYYGSDGNAEETRRRVEQRGRRCLAIKADVGEEDDVRRIYHEAVPFLGGLDILVNNAGLEQRGRWEDYDLAVWSRTLQTNLTGYFLMIREALRGNHLRDGGRIINTGSIQGLEGSATDPAYSATKGGVHALTKSLAKYLVARRILVNCVAPGPVDTPMLRSQSPELKGGAGESKYPLGVARPEQIAPVYVFLASDEGSGFTGEVLAPTAGKVTAA